MVVLVNTRLKSTCGCGQSPLLARDAQVSCAHPGCLPASSPSCSQEAEVSVDTSISLFISIGFWHCAIGQLCGHVSLKNQWIYHLVAPTLPTIIVSVLVSAMNTDPSTFSQSVCVWDVFLHLFTFKPSKSSHSNWVSWAWASLHGESSSQPMQDPEAQWVSYRRCSCCPRVKTYILYSAK